MTWVVRAIRSNEGSSVHDLSPSPRARCTIEMKFWSRKAGDGQATARIGDGPDSPGRLTKNRTLAQTAQGASRKSAVWSVRGSQNALFLTCANAAPPHGKPHSAAGASRKTAFCNHSLTEKRTLPRRLTKTRTLPPPCPPQHGTAPLSPHSSPREWCSKRPFS